MSLGKAMSTRNALWLARSVCALSLVLTALGLTLLALNRSHPNVVPDFAFAFRGTVIVASCSTDARREPSGEKSG